MTWTERIQCLTLTEVDLIRSNQKSEFPCKFRGKFNHHKRTLNWGPAAAIFLLLLYNCNMTRIQSFTNSVSRIITSPLNADNSSLKSTAKKSNVLSYIFPYITS